MTECHADSLAEVAMEPPAAPTMILVRYMLENPGVPRSELVPLMSPEDQAKVEELLDGGTLEELLDSD